MDEHTNISLKISCQDDVVNGISLCRKLPADTSPNFFINYVPNIRSKIVNLNHIAKANRYPKGQQKAIVNFNFSLLKFSPVILYFGEAHLGPNQISTKEPFAKTSILDLWVGPKYTSELEFSKGNVAIFRFYY